MRKRLREYRFAIFLCAVVLIAAAGGVAYATIPDAGGAIHGCYKKQTGALRVVDTSQACLPSERSISWNQVGLRGPSDGWDAQLVGTVPTGGSDISLTGGITDLPPGSYLLSGAATWPALGSGSAYLFCNLIASGAGLSGSTGGGFGIASPVGGGSVAMMGAITVPSGTADVGVQCRENSGTVSVSVQARAHAIQVATLH